MQFFGQWNTHLISIRIRENVKNEKIETNRKTRPDTLIEYYWVEHLLTDHRDERFELNEMKRERYQNKTKKKNKCKRQIYRQNETHTHTAYIWSK